MLAGQQKLSLVVFGVGVASVGVAVWYMHVPGTCTGTLEIYGIISCQSPSQNINTSKKVCYHNYIITIGF